MEAAAAAALAAAAGTAILVLVEWLGQIGMLKGSWDGMQAAALRQQGETVAAYLLLQSSFLALDVLCFGWQAKCCCSELWCDAALCRQPCKGGLMSRWR